MNTVQLECFMEVAACLNFSRAAENLRMTQPAVSHQINSLEAELGTKLFNRTSKSVELTRDGIRFIGPASDALKILRNAKARISEKDSTEVLPVGISCRNQQMLGVLAPILERLAKEIPSARPVVKFTPFVPVDALAENETIDVMFGLRNTDTSRQKIIYKELKKCRLMCVCSQKHPLARLEQVKTDMLADAALAMISRQRETPEISKVLRLASAPLQQSQLYLCDTYECAMPLVKAGLCYCILPDLPAKKEDGLKYIPITDSSPVSFGIFYSTVKGNPVLKRFIEITRQVISAQEF